MCGLDNYLRERERERERERKVEGVDDGNVLAFSKESHMDARGHQLGDVIKKRRLVKSTIYAIRQLWMWGLFFFIIWYPI